MWKEALLGVSLVPSIFLMVVVILTSVRLFAPVLHNVETNPLEEMATGGVVNAAAFGVVGILAGGVREELQRAFMLRRFEYLGGVNVRRGGAERRVRPRPRGAGVGRGHDHRRARLCVGGDVPVAAQQHCANRQPRRASTRSRCCVSLSRGREFGDVAPGAKTIQPLRPLLIRPRASAEPLRDIGLDAQRLARELCQPLVVNARALHHRGGLRAGRRLHRRHQLIDGHLGRLGRREAIDLADDQPAFDHLLHRIAGLTIDNAKRHRRINVGLREGRRADARDDAVELLLRGGINREGREEGEGREEVLGHTGHGDTETRSERSISVPSCLRG